MLGEINWNPNRKQLRQFAVVMFVFASTLGGIIAWRRGVPVIFHAGWGAGVAMALVTLFLPSAGRMMYKAWMGLGFAVGLIIGPVILALAYYGMFTPIGLILRLAGKDFLHSRRSGGASFWQSAHQRTDRASYERQF